MALRYNDQTGEFEEVRDGGSSGRPRRPCRPRRRPSGGGGWDSDTVIGCAVLVLLGAGAIWFLKTVLFALLSAKWFWIIVVAICIIAYQSNKD